MKENLQVWPSAHGAAVAVVVDRTATSDFLEISKGPSVLLAVALRAVCRIRKRVCTIPLGESKQEGEA